ncbi:rhomboid family intramembrane serine protease [Halocatena halophila]|uniref:rhomboid family intramembrane serine protease n=1 Tax=Halocatena halophila TaxID=2814576 RepID=UPI002ED01E9C
MAAQLGDWSADSASLALLAVVLVCSIGVAVGRRGWTIHRHSRERLFWGVPIGTLGLSVGLCVFYWTVQQGWATPPTTIPFRSWSYFDPEGMVSSSFAHSSVRHLLGNLLGTLTVGTFAEYHWGHYSRRPHRTGGRLRRWLFGTVPGRICCFIGGSLFVGLLSGLFSLGPTIGYSGVVFAYVGFTLLGRPIGTVLALLSSRVLDLFYRAIVSPVVTSGGHSSYVTPWWASISIHGHLLGLFLGVVLGLWVVRRRNRTTRPVVVWGATLLLTAMEGLWALYLPVGGGQFTLYRAVGVAGGVLAGLLFALAVDRTAVARWDRSVGSGLVVSVLVVLAFMAVPYGFTSVPAGTPGFTENSSVDVDGYTIGYAEEVPHQYINSVRLPLVGQLANVTTGGVIVVNQDKELWWPERTTRELAHRGQTTIRIGDVGWQTPVTASRRAWSPVGNRSTYTVMLKSGPTQKLVHTAPPSTASPVIDGRRVRISSGNRFSLSVIENGTAIDHTLLPQPNESVTAGGLTFSRTNDSLFAMTNDTRVRVATYEPP